MIWDGIIWLAVFTEEEHPFWWASFPWCFDSPWCDHRFHQRFCGRNGGCSADASGGCTDEPSDIPDHDRYECLPETGTSEHCPDHRLSDLDEHCQDRPWRDHFPERERVCHLCKRSPDRRNSPPLYIHILPNIMPTIIVAATMNIANAILMESALSFLRPGYPAAYGFLGKVC